MISGAFYRADSNLHGFSVRIFILPEGRLFLGRVAG
jgi:hypothetical protein